NDGQGILTPSRIGSATTRCDATGRRERVMVQHLEATSLESAVQELRGKIRGNVIAPGDEGYEQARRGPNGTIHRRPPATARCVDVADVIASVGFARTNALPLAIRGGGHSGPGLGTCDGGLVIDLSAMKGIRVDPEARTVRVEGGCTW